MNLGENYCDICGVDVGSGSHYHCPNCLKTCSMMGHRDEHGNTTCQRSPLLREADELCRRLNEFRGLDEYSVTGPDQIHWLRHSEPPDDVEPHDHLEPLSLDEREYIREMIGDAWEFDDFGSDNDSVWFSIKRQ